MFNLSNLDRKQLKFVKDFLKHCYKTDAKNRNRVDVLGDSLLTSARYMYETDDFDADCIEFGYLSHRTDLTDDEIRELVDDMRLVICSPYDCTGKRFTRYITTHRNPNGLVTYVHHMGLDV